jgi:hypothetical protein
MKQFLLIAVCVLGCLGGCSASPPAPCDTCDALADVVVCAPDLYPEELNLSSRIWGAVNDCSDSEAIPIEIATLRPSRVGEANIKTGVVRIDPRAWSRPSGVGPVVAHEIGHLMGYDHESDPCALMAPLSPSLSCGTMKIDECEFVF